MLRAIAALLLILGNALVVIAAFVPWLVLETTLANTFGSGELSPWTAIVGSGNGGREHSHSADSRLSVSSTSFS